MLSQCYLRALCASVVDVLLQGKFTTETLRTPRLHRGLRYPRMLRIDFGFPDAQNCAT